MSTFDLAALLLTLAAGLGWINTKIVRLPHEIGLVVMGLVAAALTVAARAFAAGAGVSGGVIAALQQVDFPHVVMNGMLAFLIFAGALNLDLRALRHRALAVAALAVLGTAVSTVIVGVGFWEAARLVGEPMPVLWALVFGALISPTDPVAVISTLKQVAIPRSIETEMQGEALFNDGIGIVIFSVLLGAATGTDGGGGFDVAHAAQDFAQEAGGGLLLGTVTGYAAYRAMRAVDDHLVEVLITLALVAGSYAIALRIGASGPLAVVAAGLVIGEKGPRDALSEHSESYVRSLWTLVEDVLNSILFLLIGLELALLHFSASAAVLAAAAVPIVLVARLVSVSLPMPFRENVARAARNLPFLVWAGVRGGISIALALSLPEQGPRAAIIIATYAVVVFTVVVQGATLKYVAAGTLERPDDAPAP